MTRKKKRTEMKKACWTKSKQASKQACQACVKSRAERVDGYGFRFTIGIKLHLIVYRRAYFTSSRHRRAAGRWMDGMLGRRSSAT